jgi:CubicO group peptidase (beta-lactamase class C family)
LLPRVKSIDEKFAEFDRPDVPGLSLMLIENGEASVVRSYGLADLETRVPCRPQTNFRIASLTKSFTAMAIMILAGGGGLSLDDKLPRFFPGFPPYGNEITIRHLLTHTSGLLDYEELIQPHATAQLQDRDVLDLLRRQDQTRFRPGAGFGYNNGGYALLALIVEVVSRQTFAEFLRANIFLPLGMTGSVAYEAGQPAIEHRALGYSRRGAAFEQTDQSLTSAVLGDGGIYSSVLDLFKWDQALYTEKLIPRALLQQVFAAHAGASDVPGSGYGLGWYVERRGGKEHVWHHGSTCGFSASFHRFPERERSVILLANRSKAGLEALVRKIAR